jgi:hypothetical protein
VFAFSLKTQDYSVCLCSSRDPDGRRAEDQPEWGSFNGMMSRCLNPNDKGYRRYGGRGITVCERWRVGGFWVFLADMGARPSPQHTIDRYPDNDGNYEPGNCRWATPKQQGRNRRSNRVIEFRGERRTVAEWSEVVGISRVTLLSRLDQLGWSVEEALTTSAEGTGVKWRKPAPRKLKLTTAQIAEIQSLGDAGVSSIRIAALFGIGKSTAHEVMTRRGPYAPR